MKLRFIRVILGFAPFLVSWIVFLGCGREIETTDTSMDSTQKALLSAVDIDVLFSDSGHLQARVKGPLVYRYTGETSWLEFPDGFQAEMYDSAQRLETTIRADYGRREESSRIMEARKNVVVRNERKNEQLNTEILIWNELKHTIHTEAPVKITTPDKVLYGEGLESNETFTDYTILRPRGEMTVKKDSI
ncbi:MAG: LPS export ABC transporter periplasmic protein LptC [bacterium]